VISQRWVGAKTKFEVVVCGCRNSEIGQRDCSRLLDIIEVREGSALNVA